MGEVLSPTLRKLSLNVSYPVSIVTRPNYTAEGRPAFQTLVFSNDKDALFGSGCGAKSRIFELLGDGTDAFRLGAQALELKERGPNGELKPYTCRVALHRAVYDPYSRAVYFVEGRALMRLDADNVVTPLAGHREACGVADGPGPQARFQLPHSLASDGAGSLFVADSGTVRRVSLPPEPYPTAAAAAAEGGQAAAGPAAAAGRAPGSGGQGSSGSGAAAPTAAAAAATPTAALPEAAAQEAVVTTVYGGSWSAGFVDVAYDSALRRLYAATMSAVYRLSPDVGSPPTRVAGWEPGTGAAGGSGAAAAATAASGGGGGGRVSSFCGISGLVAECDGEGGLLVADRQQVYRLAADGGVGSVICCGRADTSWGALGCYPCLLPNGWLALCQYHDRRLLLLQAGLRPAWQYSGGGGMCGALHAGRPGWHHEGVSGLQRDLAALLEAPDGSDDVGVVVGGSCFRCHRLILAARCAYFRRLFAGGFADSGAREVVLQDADPDAFSALLRHLYTGELAFPPHLLRPVAELADRLLLPQVVRHVHRALLSSTSPTSVVGDLVWAHSLGFTELLASLKEWYLDHQAEVLTAAPDAVRQLFVTAPDLMYDLHCATVRQAAATAGAGAGAYGRPQQGQGLVRGQSLASPPRR